MYTEEKPRRGGLLKEFVMRLILIIIFVLLLLWIIPWSKMDVNPLKDQIFNANLQTMKEAGITYFTSERLPENIGDKKTLTLQQMLDLKLLIPFTDRNGKSCDVTSSYITLEKQETEYLMKVNLKCGEEEDYILVHLGCYSYCTKDICEAKPQSTEKPSTKPVAKKDNVKPTPTPTNTFTPPKPKYQCKKVNGEYWGKYWTIVDKTTYVQQCLQPKCEIIDGVYYGKNGDKVSKRDYRMQCEKHYCYTDEGIFWGKNGNIVNEAQYKAECTNPEYKCQIVNGKYYGKNGNEVDPGTFRIECQNPKCEIINGRYFGINGNEVTKEVYEDECGEKHYCVVINGVYWGSNGKKVNYETFVKECPHKVEFEYKKEVNKFHAAEYSNWTNWKFYEDNSTTVKKDITTDTYELRDLGITKEQKEVTKAVLYIHDVKEQAGYYKYAVCKKFSYVVDGENIVRIDSDWRWTDTYVEGFNPPADTISTRWILVAVDFSRCGSDCTNHPYGRYRKQVRDVTIYSKYSDLRATCDEVEKVDVPIYVTRRKTEVKYVAHKEEVSVHKWKDRSRTLIKAAWEEHYIDYKWSYKDDYNLLSQGYTYTGKSRVIN